MGVALGVEDDVLLLEDPPPLCAPLCCAACAALTFASSLLSCAVRPLLLICERPPEDCTTSTFFCWSGVDPHPVSLNTTSPCSLTQRNTCVLAATLDAAPIKRSVQPALTV